MFEPIPALVLRKWLMRIEMAPNIEMLNHVGELLAKTEDVIAIDGLAYCQNLASAFKKLVSSGALPV
jgi:hypothetical protein